MAKKIIKDENMFLKSDNGFTLFELITTLSLLAILSTFAIPAFSKFIEKQRVTSDIHSVKSIIETARSKAISSNQSIYICGSENSLTSSTEFFVEKCSRKWHHIAVFNSRNQQHFNILYSNQLQANYQSIIWTSFQNKSTLEISATGYTAHMNGTLVLCHNMYPSLHRAISVSKSGRTTVLKDSEHIGKRCS